MTTANPLHARIDSLSASGLALLNELEENRGEVHLDETDFIEAAVKTSIDEHGTRGLVAISVNAVDCITLTGEGDAFTQALQSGFHFLNAGEQAEYAGAECGDRITSVKDGATTDVSVMKLASGGVFVEWETSDDTLNTFVSEDSWTESRALLLVQTIKAIGARNACLVVGLTAHNGPDLQS